MLYFPNAKINIGLYITEKRSDDFHNLETVFYPVGLKDVLEIIPSETFKSTVLNLNAFEGENICSKAYYLMQQYYPNLPSVAINLLKNIPVGAGLGGGSADAAFTLKALKDQFEIPVTENDLTLLAQQLGADCTFFLHNKPVFAHQKGDIFESIHLDLSAYQIILIMPNLHINTAEAYRLIRPAKNPIDLKTMIQQPVDTWKHHIVNQFEAAIFTKYPAIEQLKNYLYIQGAHYAAMSGSGASVYGIFPKNTQLSNIPLHTQIFYC